MPHGLAVNRKAAKEVFLKELARHGVVMKACEVSGIPRPTAYDMKTRDPAFGEAWERALEDAADALEFEAHRRSVEGIEKLVFQKGQAVIDPRTGEVYAERAFSDPVLMMRLKALRPEKYKDRVDVKTETVGGALEIDPRRLLALSPEERTTLGALLGKLTEGEGDAD